MPVLPNEDLTGIPDARPNEDLTGIPDATPDLTAGRVVGRFAHTVKQTPGLVSKTYRSFLEAVDEDVEMAQTPEEREFIGDLYDAKYSIMDVPAQTRVQEKNREYAEIYPEREAWKKAVIGELKAENNRIVERSKEFEQYFEMPEKYKESSGFLEDLAGGLGTSVASMSAAIAGTLLGGPWGGFLASSAAAYTQMHGYKIQELEDREDVPDAQRRLEAGIISGGIGAPLESISNLFMISKVMKLNGTWTKWLVSTLQAGAGEAATEIVQQYPDTYATIMAVNPGLTASEHLSFMWDNIGEITGEALYAGSVGGAAGMLTVGLGGGGKIAINTMLDKFVSPKQKAINEAKVARVANLIDKFEKDGITESEAVEIREMVNAPETTEVEEIITDIKKNLVFQEPIKSDTRDEVLKSVRESGKFTEEQTGSYATLWDGIARNWAELEPDRTPEQWYDEWLSKFNAGEFIETANKVYQTAAWHGGPHSFDKFTTEKIGTGEGAQAFGWGLYFTDKESIAKGYAQDLRQKGLLTAKDKDGKIIYQGDGFDYDALEAVKWLETGKRDAGQFPHNTAYYAKKAYEKSFSRYPEMLKEPEKKAVLKAIDKLADAKISYENAPTNLYKVTLHKDKKPGEYEWLEWGKKPDAATVKRVRDKLDDEFGSDNSMWPKDEPEYDNEYFVWELLHHPESGNDLYQGLSKIMGDREASLFLLRAGIDGIKYPTGTLSGVKGSDNFNYVVFDENAVTIDKKLTFQERQIPEFKTTGEAVKFGQEASEAEIAKLKEIWKKTKEEGKALQKAGKVQESSDIGYKAQLYREAFQAAEGRDFSKRVSKGALTDNPNFVKWFGNSKVVDEKGAPKVVYSGHGNVTLWGDKYTPSKATAGAFYATEDPAIASSYAMGKFGNKEYYENGEQYRLQNKKTGKHNKKLWQYELNDKQLEKIEELKKEEEHEIRDMDSWIEDNKAYDAVAKRMSYRGSKELQNIWQFYEYMGYTIAYNKGEDSSVPITERQQTNRFEDLLNDLGIGWQSADWAQPGVMPLVLKIKNPLDTSKPFPKDLLSALEKKAKYERNRSSEYINSVRWTKDYPLKEWVKDIKREIETKEEQFWPTHIPKKAIPILKEYGYDGIKDTGGKTGGEKHNVWLAFEATQIKSPFNKGKFSPYNPNILLQGDKKSPRGAIENLFNESPKIMHAFEAADPSTPIHETGHLLLEMMFQGGHEDYLIAAEWAGVEYERAMGGTKVWSSEELEKFAKGFETYLMEGKAPTSRLASVFEQLKTWLLEVYKSVKALGVELDDNIREVFDRWVSTETERQNDPIREVPGWLKADDIKADMKRRELSEDESFEAIEAEARKRVLGSLKEKRAKVEKDLEKGFRKEAKQMVNENPIYEMIADAKKRGLNWNDIVNDFGTQYLDDIVKRLPGVIKKGGEHVDTFANEYGYDTADDMMQAILNTPTKKQAEEGYYNDLWSGYEVMLEHENIAAYEDVINEEIEILNEMLGGKPKARKDLKGIIRKQTGQIKDQEYQELKAGLRQDRAVAKQAYSAGKKEATVQQLEKTKQRIKALKTQVKDRDARRKIDKRMQRIWKSKLLPEYKAQITQILSQYYNIPKSYMIQPEVSIETFLAEKEEDNKVNVNAIRSALENLPEQNRNKAGYRVPLTLEEKQAMMQPVLSLNHMGRTEKILISEKEKVELEDRVNELTTRSYDVFGQPEESDGAILLRDKVSWFEKLSETGRNYLASTGKLEFIFDILDGGGLGGPNAKLFEKYADALDREMTIGKEYLNKIKDVFKPAKKIKNWANKIHKIAGVPQSLTKEQMFMVALQSASKSGRNALMTGNGFTEQQIDAVVNEIKNQDEWQMVEGVWDVFESLYPMLNNVHKALTGINLPRVEGKYFPLKYDPQLSRQAGQFEQKAAERDLFHNAYTRPHVEAGSRIERVAGNKPPVSLSLNVINMKLTEFIHDITHQLPVRDLQKVLANEKYRAMVDNTLGKAYYDQMMPWLAHVANPRKLKTEGERWADKLRSNTTIVALGLKVSVSLKQAGSITQTIDELNLLTGSKTKGFALTAKAMSDFYRDRKQMVDFINESSPLMKNRRKNWNRELMEAYDESDIKDFGRSEAARDAYFWMIQAVDSFVTMPSWYAGYLHGMDVYHGDHNKAVRVADKVVRKTQPSANPGDLSLIHRGGKDRSSYLKLTTMFYTHFSNFQNRMWQTKQLHKLGQIDRVEAYASYWWLMIAPGLLGGFLGRREIPKGWDWLTDVIGYRLAGMPFVRDIFGPFLTGYDYTISPVVRGLKSPVKVYQYAKAKKGSKAAKESVRLSGYVFGLPSEQALITMEGVIDLMSGETKKPQRLFFRKPYKEKKQKRRSL